MDRDRPKKRQQSGWKKLLAAIKRARPMQWLWSDRYLIIMRISRAEGETISTPTPMKVNSPDDLALFDQTETWLTREAFLAEVEQRVAAGEKVFTTTLDGILAHYGWLVPDQSEAYFPLVDQHYNYPAGTAVMYNGYCHPCARGRGLHHVSLRSRVQWAFQQPKTSHVYGAIEIDNHVSRHCSEKLGLHRHEVLFRKCRFGRVTKGSLPPSFIEEYDKKR